jgi:glycolate dehydrogenase FAD-binding subunit
MKAFHPKSPKDVEEVLVAALQNGTSLEVMGAGTKREIGCPVDTSSSLFLEGLSGIMTYEPQELVLSAQAGTSLDLIEEVLAAEGQHLAFEPPDYSQVLASKDSGTLGGVIAAGLAGPRRLAAGGARDHILGLTGVTGHAESFKIGGRVVKNVTGYDLSKLITGSFGTLVVMTSLTLKVLPRPETSRTLVFEGRSAAVNLEVLRAAAASPFSVTGAALMDKKAHVRLEGRSDEIDQRAAKLGVHLRCPDKILDEHASISLWKSIRNLTPFTNEPTIWRINGPRKEAHILINQLEARNIGYMVDWAGARIWICGPGDLNIRAMAKKAGAKAMLFKAPRKLKEQVQVFHPEDKALAGLSSRIRDAFDPERILSPGRMGVQ